MNRTVRCALWVALFLVPVGSLVAQSSSFESQSAHYRVISEIGRDHAVDVGRQMESMLSLYNQQFHFPIDELETPLRVRIFATKSRFDSYLRRLVGEVRDGFVYLHYDDLEKSELVGYYTDEDTLEQSLIHQSFVQFFRTFVPNPPLWLREGFAVYFEASEYDPEFGTVIYRENLAWLDTLKAMAAGSGMRSLIPLDEMLSMSLPEAREQIDSFYPQAWGMVSFLLNDESGDINRILWDSLSALEIDHSLQENVDAVYREAFRWVEQNQLIDSFMTYVDSRRSFRGWVSYGVERYEAGDAGEAESAFVQALKLREDNYVPHYYLGLINYERNNYTLADFYYQEALERGSEEAITLYALGVNAYADNRFEDAVAYLEMTVDYDPAYRERAENLLVRIRG